MGYLFYELLGGNKKVPIRSTHNDNFDLFSKVESSSYWSATDYASDKTQAWYFNMNNGFQDKATKANTLYAWAVFSGDISAVPVPAGALLFGSGLLGLFGLGRRRSANP